MAEDRKGVTGWLGPALWLAHRVTEAAAVFSSLNLLVGLAGSELDANWVWLAVPAVPGALKTALLAAFAVGVLGWRWLGLRARRAARAVGGLVALGCLVDSAGYGWLLATGRLADGWPVPLSLPLAGALAAWALWPPRPVAGWWRRSLRLAGLATVMAGCLLAQLMAFGATDYRRPADAIVVFGAGVRPDGEPSLALYDRTRTGCELYHQGLAPTLILSGGGYDDGRPSEPVVMRRIALACGVPEEALVLDEGGVSSDATVAFTANLARRQGWRRVLAVSHGYHLSRIKLLSHRAGVAALTVPARESQPLAWLPYFVARELAAWTWHYLRPLGQGG